MTIRIRRSLPRLPHRGESRRVDVAAGWYERDIDRATVFCPKQAGLLQGGYIDQTAPGTVVMFVAVRVAGTSDSL